MRTIKQFQDSNSEILSKYRNAENGKKKKVSLSDKRKILMNNQCISAIQMGISEQIAIKMLDRTKSDVSSILSRYNSWLKNTPGLFSVKDKKVYYNNLFGIPDKKNRSNFLVIYWVNKTAALSA